MKIECPHCHAQLRGKPELAGKRVACPKCGEQVTIPAAEEKPAEAPQAATADLWEVRTEDGTIYGPVDKVELDQWVQEDRLDEHCELRHGSDQNWQPIWTSYEQFAPTPQIQTAPVVEEQPARQQVVAEPKAAVKKEVAAVAQPAQASDIVVPMQSTRYPMMLLASKIYKILGWIVLVIGTLSLATYLVITLVSLIPAFQMGWLAGLTALAVGLFTVTIACLYLAIMVISCWFISEAIGWMLDLQENSSKTNTLLTQLIHRMTK
jgi:hypothetical protein